MFSLELLAAVFIVGAIVAYLRFGAPWLKVKGFDFYAEVQLALIIAGYAFRDEKIKSIASVALMIVGDLENLYTSPKEKHEEAMLLLSKKLLDEFSLELEEEVISLLIKLAVSMLPPTNVN